jgi:O-acetyl-ADP-ribose deacetylase (regulator of RNase III)
MDSNKSSLARRILVVKGDITVLDVDAIVNAANTTLLGGGGVDGAIHRAAGPGLLEECRKLGGCPTGDARVTRGYNLPARWVIHTVGPVWHGGDQDEDHLLASCYRTSLGLATLHNASTIAFPAISTGAYRFPLQRAAAIAIRETGRYLARDAHIRKLYHVCFDQRTHDAFRAALERGESSLIT